MCNSQEKLQIWLSEEIHMKRMELGNMASIPLILACSITQELDWTQFFSTEVILQGMFKKGSDDLFSLKKK